MFNLLEKIPIKIKKTINIIGSGVGGLAAAIRLAHAGYAVSVFEKNAYPGGKLSEMRLGSYRFDKGPSLFTMPQLIEELRILTNYKEPFAYTKLKTLTNYFFEDGTEVTAKESINDFAKELNQKLGEEEKNVKTHLEKSAFYYQTTSDLFLNQSLHQFKNFINFKTLKGIFRAPKLNLLKTMHQQNASTFKNNKTVQIFDRYATYNGSSPYKAPALLNIIPHLEFGMGAFLPEKGMHQITEYLYKMALNFGVDFKFNTSIKEIVIESQKAIGVKTETGLFLSDYTISDADINLVYTKLLPETYKPKRLLKQEKSSSAFVFYFGIKKEFPQLGLHNILFSENYEEEFSHLFESQNPYHDPTIYINITSKFCEKDAPKDCENWFVMINVPHNKSQQTIKYAEELRKNVIAKINRMLKINLEELIEYERTLDPLGIEIETSSFGGSLYGNSSNSKWSAFFRHPNYSTKIKNLYFVGGSVHPGGGIPLCLLSAKIVSKMIQENKK